MAQNINNKLYIVPTQQSVDNGIRLIICTTPDKKSACTIAQKLLDDKLAACVTLLPKAVSFYYWHGILEQQNEVQMLIKSNTSLQQVVFEQIKAHHPYQVPELLVIPVTGIDPDYLSWLNEFLR